MELHFGKKINDVTITTRLEDAFNTTALLGTLATLLFPNIFFLRNKNYEKMFWNWNFTISYQVKSMFSHFFTTIN